MAKTAVTKSVVKSVLDYIRNNASANFKNYVPAVDEVTSAQAIGDIIMDVPVLRNEYLNALVQKFAMTRILQDIWEDPFSVFTNKGDLRHGGGVEQIFVDLATPYQYDKIFAENKVDARFDPAVRAAYFVINYKLVYPASISYDLIRDSFTSDEGMASLIDAVVQSTWEGAKQDIYETYKYMLGKNALNGRMVPVALAGTTTADMKDNAGIFRGVSNDFTFRNRKYNPAGVSKLTKRDDQFLLMNTRFDSTFDVEVLASAFNMEKADFLGHRIIYDAFANMNWDRIGTILADDPDYRPFTDAEIAALDQIPGFLISRDFYQVYNVLDEMRERENELGLWSSYFLHTWRVMATSPFAQTAIFVLGDPAVTSITVTPSTATVSKGQEIQLTPTVVTQNFAPKTVTWELADSVTDEPIPAEDAEITAFGLLKVPADSTASGITVKAVSTYDDTVIGSATITVA